MKRPTAARVARAAWRVLPAALLLLAMVATHVGWQLAADPYTAFYALRAGLGALLFVLLAARGDMAWVLVCSLGVIAEASDAICSLMPDPGAGLAVQCDRVTGLPVSISFAWLCWAVGAALVSRQPGKDHGTPSPRR